MAEEESGLDELMRLSRQFTRQKAENEAKERQREEQGKKVRGVLQGLQELNINMALQQLKTVAAPEIIRQVNALKTGGGTEDLRKMISSLADDLEKGLGARKDTAPLVNAMRTLNILLDLYFSLH
jgi:ribosomal protein L22